jgi:hypothetical protein
VIGHTRIAQKRMADGCHVNAHLMRAPGFQPAFDQGGISSDSSSR